jgi:hypothetical protein
MAFVKPVKLLADAVINHPKKSVLDEYFGVDTRKFIFDYSVLEQSEIEAANYLIDLLKPKEIIRLSEVKIPKNIKTPDFWIDKVKYEIKAPKNIRQIQKRVKEGKEQIAGGGYLVLSSHNCRNKESQFLNEAKRSARQYRINSFYYISKDDITLIQIKK